MFRRVSSGRIYGGNKKGNVRTRIWGVRHVYCFCRSVTLFMTLICPWELCFCTFCCFGIGFFFSLVISMWNKKNVLCFSSSKLSFNRVGMEKSLGCSRLKRGLFFRLAEGMMHALSVSTFISVGHDEQECTECERNPNWHLNNIFLFTAIPGCH